MTVTLKTIAEKTQLSPGAVSRILNFKEKEIRINARTAERVRQVASELGYVRNPQARNLRLNISNVIGALIHLPESVNDLYYHLFKGISQATSAAGKTLMFHDCDTHEEYENGIKRLLEYRVEGIITLHSEDARQRKIVDDLFKKGTKVIVVNSIEKNPAWPYINCDHELGGFKATEHLIQLGHKRIAHISNNVKTSVGNERYKGYCRALRQYGLEKDDSLIFNAEKGGEVQPIIPKLLAVKNRPTAIFAWNDSTAFAAQRTLVESGIRVPEDIAIIGFDDRDFTHLSTVSISTVRYPMYRIGQQAVKAIIDGNEAYKNYLIEPELVIRASSGGER